VCRELSDTLTTLESEVRRQGIDREVRYALFSPADFTDELRSLVNERSDVSLYELAELAPLFGPQR